MGSAVASTVIVKVQKPLHSSSENPPALVYDQYHTLSGFLPATKWPALVKEDEPKAYWLAARIGDSLEFIERVEAQDW